MSPKINRALGATYENDPVRLPEVEPGSVETDDMRELGSDGREQVDDVVVRQHEQPTGDEPNAGNAAQQIGEPEQRPDYGTWTKAQLNAELDRREIEHDPKANNAVLIEELERSDAGGTITGVND